MTWLDRILHREPEPQNNSGEDYSPVEIETPDSPRESFTHFRHGDSLGGSTAVYPYTGEPASAQRVGMWTPSTGLPYVFEAENGERVYSYTATGGAGAQYYDGNARVVGNGARLNPRYIGERYP